MKIYVASSWRNEHQQSVVRLLRKKGYEVYDFKNPHGKTGFSWSEVSPDWKNWSATGFKIALESWAATEGFNRDFNAMEWADACVLVQPCGASAHLELGWFVGKGKPTVVLLNDRMCSAGHMHFSEPELMYRMVDHLATDEGELLEYLKEIATELKVKHERIA